MQIKRKVLRSSQNVITSATFGGAPLILPLDRDQYIHSLDVHFLGRLTLGVHDGNYVNAEVPQNVVREMRVRMSHEIYGSNFLVQRMMGATYYRRGHIFSGTAPVARITPAAAVTFQSYDIEVHYPIVFPLEKMADIPTTKSFGGKTKGGWMDSQTVINLLDAPRCSDLTLEIDLAAGGDLINPDATTTFAWHAYGSATGVPQILVTENVVNGLQGAPLTAMVRKVARNDLLEGSVSLNNRNANEIPLGGTIARVMLKQFSQDAATSVPCAQTMLSPKTAASAGLATPQFFRNGVAIREHESWAQLEAQNKADYGLESWPAGYGLYDYVEDGKLHDALFTQELAKKKGIIAYGGVVNGNAGQRVEMVVEEILANPRL